MAIDVAPFEQAQLVHGGWVAEDHAGVIHKFRQPDGGGMVHQRDKIPGLDPGAGGFHLGRGNAGRQLHANVHQGMAAGLLKIADAIGADHVGDFMWIADCGRHPQRRHAAVEFERCDERAFDMQMRVDEAWHQCQVRDIDGPLALIGGADPHDRVTTDRHVARDHRVGHKVPDHAAA